MNYDNSTQIPLEWEFKRTQKRIQEKWNLEDWIFDHCYGYRIIAFGKIPNMCWK